MAKKEVYFWDYCHKCVNASTYEGDDPCNDCLNSPANEDSHMPLYFKESAKSAKTKKEKTNE